MATPAPPAPAPAAAGAAAAAPAAAAKAPVPKYKAAHVPLKIPKTNTVLNPKDDKPTPIERTPDTSAFIDKYVARGDLIEIL